MITSPKAALSAVIAATASAGAHAFTPQSFLAGRGKAAPSSRSPTSLRATVDPSTITKKEYQDICGVDFDDATLADRLAKTAYLYPKHVEVIDDFAPMVDKMVDEIVSGEDLRLFFCICGWCLPPIEIGRGTSRPRIPRCQRIP